MVFIEPKLCVHVQHMENLPYMVDIIHVPWRINLSTFKRVRFMVFNTTFNNISVISWRSALFVEETRVPGKNH